MTELVGRNLGQNRIVERIAVGGMATIYRAFQPSLDRYVAVKVLHSYIAQQPGFTDRFNQEAKSVAKLAHPHVLPVYDFGTEQDLPYLVTQFVDAGTLSDLLTAPLDPYQAADILAQIAEALQCAHDMGIVHRDIKPANVLMDRGHWVLLTDFGLAKMVGENSFLSTSGIGVGTPTYMAPEQGQGLEVDHRADIYSMGVILYQMTTGIPPFHADNAVAVVVKHVMEPLILPHVINPDIPEAVERVILKAMAKTPQDRYQTATDMAQALKLAVGVRPHPGDNPVPISTPIEVDAAAAHMSQPPSPDVSTAHRSSRKWIGPRLQKAMAGAALLAVIVLVSLVISSRLSVGRKAPDGRAAAISTPSSETQAPTPPQTIPASPLPGNAAEAPTPSPQESVTTISADEAIRYARDNPPTYEDDFSDPGSGWQRVSDRQASRDYVDNAYVIRVPAAIGQRNQVNVPLPLDEELADFVLEVHLRVDAGLDSAGGLVGFREQNTDNLFAGLSAKPCQAFIGMFSANEEAILGQNTGCGWQADARSHLTLIAAGQQITLLVNGEQRVAAETLITAPGTLHLLVTNADGEDVVLRVEKVRLWNLEPLLSAATP